jgi:hypothetical protein
MSALRYLDVSSNRLSGTLPNTLEEIRHSILDMNFGLNEFKASNIVPAELCEMQAGNICRGGGACVGMTCACADGASGELEQTQLVTLCCG